ARVPLQVQRAQVVVDSTPDLAVGVHLRAGDVVPHRTEVQRADVDVPARLRELTGGREGHVVVADTADRVAGHVRADGPRVGRAGQQTVLVEVLGRDEVRPALAHGAGVEAEIGRASCRERVES